MSKGVREAPGKALIGELAAESGDKTEGAFGMPKLSYFLLPRFAVIMLDLAVLQCCSAVVPKLHKGIR